MSQGKNSHELLEQQVRNACRELGRRLRAGDECRAEDFLAQFPAIDSEPELAMELIYTEYVVREEMGQPVGQATEWSARFPQWWDELQQVFEVHDQVCQSESQRLLSTSEGSRTSAMRGERRGGVPATLTPGRRIGNYELLEEIGRGGMGVVYRAQQLNLNRLVALKMILSGEYASARELERFRREAEAAAQVQHPNIVQVYEVGVHDLRPFLTMELVPGGNLETALKERSVAPREAAQLIATIARAVAAAHQRGIVHRDLKPANILLLTDGTPKVADFGLATQLDNDRNPTRTGTIVGTPCYMAPEQAQGKVSDIGPATDVYSLGAILYEALCGEPPFAADTSLETLRRVAGEEPVPPSRRASGIPRDLETICLKCLEKAPHRRFASATDLADELQRFLRYEPIRSRSVGSWERTAKWIRRRPVTALFLASLMTSVVVMTSLWLTAEQRRREASDAALRADQERTAAAQSRQEAVRERERAEHSLYLHRVGQAYTNWQARQIGRAQQLLAECPPELRHWEWSFLNTLCHMDRQTLTGHTDEVMVVANSRDSRWIVSGSGVWGLPRAGEVIVWESDTGRQRSVFRGHNGPISCIDISPDSQRVISASLAWQSVKSAGVKIWDLDGNELVNFAPPCDNARVAKFSPDGRTVMLGALSGVAHICDASTGEIRYELSGHKSSIQDAAFSPDGKLLATVGRDGVVCVWDLATRKQWMTPFTGYQDVRHVAFSPDGRYLTFVPWGGTIYVWELASPRSAIKRFHYEVDVICGMAISPEGRRVALAAKDGTVLLVAIDDGRELKRLHGHSGGVRDVAFSPDGLTLFTAGVDRLVKSWDARTDARDDFIDIGSLAKIGDIHRFSITPDGKKLLLPSGFDPGWPDRGNKTLVVWNLVEPHIDLHIVGHTDWINSATSSPDGKQYASASDDKTARLWDAANGKQLAQWKHSAKVLDVAFLPTGDLLATATADGEVTLWDIKSKQQKRQWRAHTGPLFSLLCDADGKRLFTAGEDATIRVWDPATGEERGQFVGHEARVTSLALSQNGKLLASTSADETVRVWDLEQGVVWRILRGHHGAINDATFSADARRLVSIGQDQNVKIWDVEFGEEALNMHLPNYGAAVRFHPDGKRLIAIYDWYIKIWSSQPASTDVLEARHALAVISWHKLDGGKSIQQKNEFAREVHIQDLVGLQCRDESIAVRRGLALAELGALPEALDAFRTLVSHPVRNPLAERTRALLALVLDERDEFRDSMSKYWQRAEMGMSVPFRMDAVKLASLASETGLDRWELVRKAEECSATIGPARWAESQGIVGAALYRAGAWELARETLLAAQQFGVRGNRPYEWLFLAMTEAHLGNHDAARQWLRRAIASTSERSPRDDVTQMEPWAFWEQEILLCEALAVIDTLSGLEPR